MHFNLVHVLTPVPNEHALRGYSEVIETFQWGLSQLGHQVTTQANGFEPNAINIIFGGQMLSESHFAGLPDNSIFYNLEEMPANPPQLRKRSIWLMSGRYRIWDYAERNLAAWRQHNPRFEPIHVPIGYSPTLTRIAPTTNPPIDVLFYGIPAPPRLDMIHHLAAHNVRTLFACGLYGEARDRLIGHSRIVLNLGKDGRGEIFEIARVAYLLANRKAVVSDLYPTATIDMDLHNAIAFTPRPRLTETCLHLLADDKSRAELAERGLQAIQKRDIRGILQNALRTIE